jgi:hypothetical protein
MLDSQINTDFGITGSQAIKQGLISKGTKLSYKTNQVVNGGYECCITGVNYNNMYEAVKAHFEAKAYIKQQENEQNEYAREHGLFMTLNKQTDKGVITDKGKSIFEGSVFACKQQWSNLVWNYDYYGSEVI